MSITSEDLVKVYLATFEARNKWRNIFLVLGVSPSAIQALGRKWKEDPDDCYREGLFEWLQSGERTWQELIEALSSPVVGQKDIANVIEKDHVQSTATSVQRASAAAAEVTLPNPSAQVINENLTIFSNENIGTGAFGAVFKGSYRGSPCAVKVLHHVAMQIQTTLSTAQADEPAIQAFECECEFLKSFQHPNIVQHLSTDKYPKSSNVILVTELLDCNLRSYFSHLAEETFTSDCELNLSRDIASGLAYIHSKKVIHRDLCGDNILLKLAQPVPVAKISDFGMSRFIDPTQLSSTLTAVGHRKGYLPPEALREDDELYDHNLDVFSLGVVMVQIALKLATVKTVKDRTLFLGQIPVTHPLKSLINDCVQMDKSKRPSAGDVCVELERMFDLDSMDTSAQIVPAQGLRPTLKLKWRNGRDLPVTATAPQSVVIADAVYVGGDWGVVLKLDINEMDWTILQQPTVYNVAGFAMTSLADELVLVGGLAEGKLIDQVMVYQSGKWARPYPPMHVARMDPTAISFDNHIIVVGGGQTSVSVFDLSSMLWYEADPLPATRYLMKSAVVGAKLYVMGGGNQTVNTVDINKLITKAASAQAPSTSLWGEIKGSPLPDSALLSIRGSLLAVGGRDGRLKPSSSIHLYQPETNSWVKVGDMPTEVERWGCTCSLLPNGEAIIAGGIANVSGSLDSVFFMSIEAVILC